MRNTRAVPVLHGFSAAVAREPSRPELIGKAAIAVGRDRADGSDHLVLSIRHADGEAFVATLSEAGVRRLCRLIAEVFHPSAAPVPIPSGDRELYEVLTRSKRMPAADARRAIEELRDVEARQHGGAR